MQEYKRREETSATQSREEGRSQEVTRRQDKDKGGRSSQESGRLHPLPEVKGKHVENGRSPHQDGGGKQKSSDDWKLNKIVELRSDIRRLKEKYRN